MIVVDASAVVLGLLNDGAARRSLATDALAVPHLADAEVPHALRAQVLRRTITEPQARAALDRWARLGIRRFASVGLLDRVWELRDNLTAYDATYIALAEAIGCEVMTTDARLAAAPGPTCPIVVVRT
ncbi:MAG TPA: type II toxin-antitoxin system VapC family toxin [Acidimicrobiales bacterium]|nr:type II toxin-antitoxin system VapC family toxin [Acidimicrobiales bacterium]